MRALRWSMYLFVGLGLLLLTFGVSLVVGALRFQARAAHATGTVVELQTSRANSGKTMYAPVVRYTPQGHGEITFVSGGSSNPPEFDPGERVDVLYVPGNPQKAQIGGFSSMWLGPVVVSGMGLMFTSIGLGFILYRRMSEKKKSYLLAYGTAVETEFQAVERNQSLIVNGRSPWRIVSQWRSPATGNVHVFNSENLWFDPTNYVSPGKITVLLDPKNERRYYMDTSFLPKRAES
ncbi:MAG: DUF3592 domain-containing protein [Pseudomonadota bacterium]